MANDAGAPQYHFATQCPTVSDPAHTDQYGASSMPIYMTATFKGLPGAEFDYTRSGNPTRTVLQNHLSTLQNAKHTYTVSTGMACMDIISRFVRPHERVVAGNDLYGGTNRILGILRADNDVVVDHVDTTNATVFENHIRTCAEEHALGKSGRVAMVLLESPTNPLLQICDLALFVRLVRTHIPEALVVVDNTMLSPYLMRPLEFGVDIVYDSATKYLSGHHDIMAGILACNRDDLAQRIYFFINSVGNALAPMDSFLLLRGVKTLALRMDKQQENAMQIAHFLDGLGFRVHFPGLRSHPGYAAHNRNAKGPGSVMSFETGDRDLSLRVTASTKLWGVSVSFGCVNSLISMPALMSHASIDAKVRAERGLPENLIRLCTGIEDVHDLLADLTQALLTAGAIRQKLAPDGMVEYERGPVQDEMETLRAQLRAASPQKPSATVPASLTVSAPGKVILFGEHAVVHGVTAIAAATALRCYAHVDPRADASVSLRLTDIDLQATWERSALPWELVTHTSPSQPPHELEPRLMEALDVLLAQRFAKGDKRRAACGAFLYLYMHLARPDAKHGQTFVLRSSLPIGAGLGSSAAVSVCLASLLLYTHGLVPLPTDPEASLPNAHVDVVNGWAFLGEKVMHGEPSGVDNTVASYGGAIAFTRALPTNTLSENRLKPIKGFDALRLLITDTRVPRNTKGLVASVGEQKAQDPERVQAAFDTVQIIADEAQQLLDPPRGPAATRETVLARLGRLMDMNHLQLVQLRVGHPALETVRKACAVPHALHTKLTGGGGGGCAITLLRDNLSADELNVLLQTLATHGFTTYETSVGGPGMGVLVHPSSHSALHAAQWADAPADQLATWASASGTWAFA
ncbi:cysteine-S-conjugate beta-lyase [Malassezia vespertilionis]|uniref:Cystathionine beta-lyase n=1 Tax=Malassezia vespertilionis TaxID=2020962 RepID=A0A2N1JH16_9BASI|nr:cysteine-S-conjugate beta-lyase [Malassezia vespertilionis]PKI85840.1 Str3p [Malassezia vespertilionis]WFD05325.1 cysteine-S-conjugate beta-lyase [Malassezia vespertilionis]